MSLTSFERHALADVQEELSRSDPSLSAAFGRLTPHPSRWWWAAVAAAVALVAGAVELFGPLAVAAVGMLLVLASPLAVAFAPRSDDGPPERP